MKHYFIDTNLIVRFITGEPEEQAELVANFLQKSDDGDIVIHITPIVIAEVVFVLTGKVYEYPKKAVCQALEEFIDNPAFEVPDLDCLKIALGLFAKHSVDFADAYLGASAALAGAEVATFDSDFKKLKDVKSLNLKSKSK